MNEPSFDYIAIPRGQLPGGPVQTSAGDWVIVLPVDLDLAETMRRVENQRAGRPVTDAERRDLAQQLGK